MASVRSLGARRLVLFAAVALTAALAGAGALAGFSDAVAYLAPALVLLAALSLRCYPGQRTLVERLAAHRATRVRPRSSRAPSRQRGATRVLLARGGALLGSALAVRPPPRAAMHAPF